MKLIINAFYTVCIIINALFSSVQSYYANE